MLAQPSQWSADIRANEIDQIMVDLLTADAFSSKSRQASLLRYLLNYASSGFYEPIKERTIAIDVFGRDSNFDAARDSIVRSEMHRLRKSLNLYNLRSAPSTYKVAIPQQSYVPEILRPPSRGLSKLRLPKFALGWRYLISGVLLLCALGLGSYGYSKFKGRVMLQVPIAPLIGFSSDSKGSSEGARTFQKLKQAITLRIASDPLFRLNNELDPDYTLNFDLPVEPSAVGLYEVGVTLYGDNGGLLWTKRYEVKDLSSRVNISAFVSGLYTDVLYYDGIIPKLHATGLVGSSQSIALYRCLLDARSMLVTNISSYNKSKDLLECLDPDSSNVPVDKAVLSLARASLYASQLAGEISVGGDITFEQTDQEIKLSRTYSSSLKSDLEAQLRLELQRKPKRKIVFIERLLKKAHRLYPADEYLLGLAAHIYGVYLDDWDSANTLVPGLLNDVQVGGGMHARVYLEKAIDKQDFLLAKRLIATSKMTDHKFSGLYQIVVGCQVNDAELLNSGVSLLEKQGIKSEADMLAFVEHQRYKKSFEETLLSGWSNETCQVF